jgi:hypothetical protein
VEVWPDIEGLAVSYSELEPAWPSGCLKKKNTGEDALRCFNRMGIFARYAFSRPASNRTQNDRAEEDKSRANGECIES